ncbi:thiopurine S-methyltransferase [Achromobacter xylosoxidans]|uniref:thiopurine S-methyltransferase n=1 Tax=Alcaligenes xylosoxydans xylosoxydans TaxID=85698 RepID=UPI0003D5DD82|nr:thiopurine S-methyltransferase [Achromobacter xylosoxidans]AHC49164.1 thiopurine S-methyltransferase [Achromobacter xylosoxidans NBRC 15126 = ATCC 27061]QKQ53451.1 thiopurine S-methyltransferase [Achromobacter xylosoxidans]QPR97401.1 thiopurine S-methyltransferase [Achromobacter xylosoxidans]UON41345.1 thiopurine S-methyltransferase [Achromobacter xylosoxidans]CKI01226.1 Thiopurine S-methyltransferase [Achromobacter xylosoxidans]
MDAEFWLERWRDGRTHFHQTRVTPLLQKYWPTLSVPAGGKVLVPLCGKSLDMVWLAAQGYQVLGVELSQLAVEQFFTENELKPVIHESAYGRRYVAGNIEIICGDIFKLDAPLLSHCVGAYDRAALVALPADMRGDYVRHVYGQLAPGYRGLLITLDYPQEEMDGPPFAVVDAEMRNLFTGVSPAVIIDRRDILAKEPKFAERGVSRLDTVVYRLGVQA